MFQDALNLIRKELANIISIVFKAGLKNKASIFEFSFVLMERLVFQKLS